MEGLLSILNTSNNMPLYFVILHYWIRIFGESDAMVRLLSVLWGSIGLAGFFYLLKYGLNWSKRSVLTGLLLLSVNPFHIHYSIEARPYSMFFAFSTFYLAFLLRMHKEHQNYFIPFAIFQALLLYTHPAALIYCFAINVAYMLMLILNSEKAIAKVKILMSANLITAVVFSPVFLVFLRKVQFAYETFWAQLPSLFGALKIWGSISLFWSPELVEWCVGITGLLFIKPVLWLLLSVPVALLMAQGVLCTLNRKNLAEFFIITSLFAYPMLIYVISLFIKPILVTKILIPSLIALIVLVVTPSEKCTYGGKRYHSLLIALFLMISICLTLTMVRLHKSVDWRKVSSTVEEKARRDDLVLFYSNHGASLFKRYYKGDIPLYVKGLPQDFEEELKQRKSEGFQWRKRSPSLNSEETFQRFTRLIHDRERFILVLFPFRNKTAHEGNILLKRVRHYRIEETTVSDIVKIYLFTRSGG